MAISSQQEPAQFHPAYNQSMFAFDSTNKAQPNFKYIIDVYDELGITYLNRFKVSPRPIDGFGEFDLSSYLQSKVSYDLYNASINGTSTSVKSQFPYKLKVGEEYTTPWIYNDFGYVTSGVSTQYEGKVRLGITGQITTHTYQVGQYINVNQTDGGILYPSLQGLHQILFVISSTAVIIDVDYFSLNLTTPMGGSTVLSNNQTTSYPNLFTTNVHCAFNAALNYTRYINYDENAYLTSATVNDALFLSNLPINNFYMTRNQPLFLNFNYYRASVLSVVDRIKFTNSNGDEFLSNPITTSNASNPRPWIRQVSVGTDTNMAINVQVGTAGLIKADTKWYTFQLYRSGFSGISQIYKIYIDDRCVINNNIIMFLDKMGSWSSFAFQLRQKQKYNIDKSTYNKTIDYTNMNGMNDGMVVYNSNVEREYTLQTNWMTEEMGIYFEELISSPKVFLQLENQQFESVIVQDTSGERIYERNKHLIKKEITVKSAYIENINI